MGRNGRTLGPSWQVGAEVRAQSRRGEAREIDEARAAFHVVAKATCSWKKLDC